MGGKHAKRSFYARAFMLNVYIISVIIQCVNGFYYLYIAVLAHKTFLVQLRTKICINSFIMPHTSFIEKSRKHNFHFERNPQKILQLRKLIMALRHLIKAAKVTKRKLIWWRWKAVVFKYVSLQTTNV